MTKVYELYDMYGNVVHVGTSKHPERRLYEHTKKKRHTGQTGHGKFYGQQLTIEVVADFECRKEAFAYQCKLQENYGLITDRDLCVAAGKRTDNTRRTVTPEVADRIREQYSTGNYTMAKLGNEYGVSHGNIYKIIHRKSGY